MERVADAYEPHALWTTVTRGTHLAAAHPLLQPVQAIPLAARFLLSRPHDAAAASAGLPAIQALWNVAVTAADEDRSRSSNAANAAAALAPPPPAAAPAAPPMDAAPVLSAAVCAVFLWGRTSAQAAFSGAHLVASVANPTNPAGFLSLSASGGGGGIHREMDPAEAARVVGAAVGTHPRVPEVAGAGCLALGSLLSMDWCAPLRPSVHVLPCACPHRRRTDSGSRGSSLYSSSSVRRRCPRCPKAAAAA